MVGAEWRKASRIYEALKEKIKRGDYVDETQFATIMFQAWEQLPADFREKMEKRISNKQYGPLREQIEREIDAKIKTYDNRINEYRDAEIQYNKRIQEAKVEQMKLDNMKNAVKMGEALRIFFKTMGIDSSIQWWNV
jgi:hypothetical protein